MADLPSGDRDLVETHKRRRWARARLQAAAERDAAAHARDVAAEARDQIAALHDEELAARDDARADDARRLTAADAVAIDRRRAAVDRALAAQSRAEAAEARRRAARDREQAARDRLEAQADREMLMRRYTGVETDPPTETRMRAAGLANLEHEIERARRIGQSLVVAYIDVSGLKIIDETAQPPAGDWLLERVAEELRDNLRRYDLLVRVGGDEFLCAMLGATRHAARERFHAVRAALAATPERIEIEVGLAALGQHDSADALLERADAELPAPSGSAAG